MATTSRARDLLLLATAALTLLASAAAQGLKELRLKDGRVLIGAVRQLADSFEVETHEGRVSVDRQDVAKVRSHKELQAALKSKAKQSRDSAFACLQLARLAHEYGLEPEMWRLLDRTLDKLATEAAARQATLTRRLREFLAQLEPALLPRAARQASTEKRVQLLLRGCHASTKPSKLAALEELMVREPNADAELRSQARRNGSYRQRIAALSALQRRATAGNGRFVLRSTVLDRSDKVRAAAAEIGRPVVGAADVTYMAGGLGHHNAKVRVRTAEALGRLQHEAAVDLLVRAGPYAASGLRRAADDAGASRGHVAFLNQQAYIRDFDVEVAQASFIADPQIDVLQSGAVLDATVIGVTEIRRIVYAYRDALKLLTRHDPGEDPRAWAAWRAALPPREAAAATVGR